MITREADYAIRVVHCLSAVPEGETLSTAALAEQMLIPYRFLRRIVRRLCAAGIVGSVRGKVGGIHLLMRPSEISVHDVLAIFDGKSLLLNICYGKGPTCPRKGKCAVHRSLMPVQKLLGESLKGLSLADMARK